FLVHLDVEVAGRPAAGTYLALGGQPHPHPVADTGRDLDADLPAGAHPPVPAAAVARIGDDLADPPAHRTRPQRHPPAVQPTLPGRDLAATTAGVAGDRGGVAVGALAVAQVAEHRGVDGDPFGHPGRALLEVQLQPQQRVRARPHPADRAAAGGSAAEEGLEHVPETAEPGEPVAGAGRARRLQRVTAHVDDAALL